MKLKQTIKQLVVAAVLVLGTLVVAAVVTPTAQAACDGVETAVINCETDPSKPGVEGTGIWQVLLIAINILTAGVAIAAIAGLIYASILYTSAGGGQEQLKKAYTMFTNIVIGIIAYALMYSGLNFLIPGGLFN